jgi:predicted transcriptional regulator
MAAPESRPADILNKRGVNEVKLDEFMDINIRDIDASWTVFDAAEKMIDRRIGSLVALIGKPEVISHK